MNLFEVGTVHSVRKGDGSWHSAEVIHRRVNEGGTGRGIDADGPRIPS